MKLRGLCKLLVAFYLLGNQAIAATNYQFNPELTAKYIKSCEADIYFYDTLFKCDGYTVQFLAFGGNTSVITIQNSTSTITTKAAKHFQRLIQDKVQQSKHE